MGRLEAVKLLICEKGLRSRFFWIVGLVKNDTEARRL